MALDSDSGLQIALDSGDVKCDSGRGLERVFGTCSVTFNWEEFTFPQVELKDGPSASPDRSDVPQGDQEPHLIQQSEPNRLVRD